METSLIKSYHHETFGDVRIQQGSRTPVCFEDVCKVLDIKNTRNVIQRLNSNGVHTVDTIVINSRNASHTKKNHFISWGNFCRLVAVSRKEIAIPFQNWMFDEVMESVFTSGGYAINNEISLLKQENEALKQRLNIIENYYTNSNIKKQLKSTYKVAKMLGFNKVKEFCQLLDYVGIIIYWNNEVILTPKYDNPEYAEYVTWWKGKRKIEYVNWTEKGINAIVQELGLEIQK